MVSALLLLPNLGRRWEEDPPPWKEGLKTREGYRRGEKLRTPVPGHLTFFTFVLATFFLLFLFLFIYFPLPPSFFFYSGRKRKCWVSFSFSFFFSFFFSWIETHISPFFECEEVPYLRVVLSPAGGILALSPLQQYSLQLLTLICTRDSIFFFLFTFAFFYHYYFLGFFFFSFKRPRYVCLSFICSHFFLRRVLSRFNTQNSNVYDTLFRHRKPSRTE